jgi:hypothetical protein
MFGQVGLFTTTELLAPLAQSARNGLVVMLDGLDELGAEDIALAEAFTISLAQFFTGAPGRNLVVVASRRQALDFAPRLTSGTIPGMTSVDLQPFSSAAVYSFLLRWPYLPTLDPIEEAQRMFSQLRLRPALLDACTNPLSLALYVSRDLRMRQSGIIADTAIIDTRAEFFDEVVGYLLVRRRADREGIRAPSMPFKQARFRFFSEVAKDHIESADPYNRIDAQHLVKHSVGIKGANDSADDAILDIAKETGIIGQNDDGTWSFIHRSFLDFFLAQSLMASSNTNRQITRLVTLLHKAPLRYEEGFYFSCGLMAARNWPKLPDILEALGSNALAGHHYPRACLEAQAYALPRFSERIKYYCQRWKRDRSQTRLLRDLVAVLVDYERSCRDLSQSPEVSFKGQLWPELEAQGYSLLQAVHLDIELGMDVAGSRDLLSLLERSATEEAVLALYDPAVVSTLKEQPVEDRPELAAVIAEAALRSSLLASALSAPKLHMLRMGSDPTAWSLNWSVRNSKYAAILNAGLLHLQGLRPSERIEFPHLNLLTYTKPRQRIRTELILGDWRLTVLLASLSVAAGSVLVLLGSPPAVAVAVVLAVALMVLLNARRLVLRRVITLATMRALNMAAHRRDIGGVLGHRLVIVAGSASTLPRFSLRRPIGGDGEIFAAYERSSPFLWRRFAPSLGDDRLSRSGCAAIQQRLWTEDIRRLERAAV